MTASPMLTVEGLHAGYAETEVLRGVDLTVNAGEVVAVLGSNGVGKSTLNRTLSGILRARAGSILFDGAELAQEKPAAIVARGLIHVPEGRRIFPNLPVRTARRIASACTQSSRAFLSAALKAPEHYRAANNKCLRLAAASWPNRN